MSTTTNDNNKANHHDNAIATTTASSSSCVGQPLVSTRSTTASTARKCPFPTTSCPSLFPLLRKKRKTTDCEDRTRSLSEDNTEKEELEEEEAQDIQSESSSSESYSPHKEKHDQNDEEEQEEEDVSLSTMWMECGIVPPDESKKLLNDSLRKILMEDFQSDDPSVVHEGASLLSMLCEKNFGVIESLVSRVILLSTMKKWKDHTLIQQCCLASLVEWMEDLPHYFVNDSDVLVFMGGLDLALEAMVKYPNSTKLSHHATTIATTFCAIPGALESASTWTYLIAAIKMMKTPSNDSELQIVRIEFLTKILTTVPEEIADHIQDINMVNVNTLRRFANDETVCSAVLQCMNALCNEGGDDCDEYTM